MQRLLRSVVSASVVVGLGFLSAGPVAAQAVDEVLEEVAFRGYYVEPGAEGDIDELEALLDDVDGVVLVVLADDPDRGADLFAEEIRSGLDEDVSVLVIAPGEVGAVSDLVDDETISGALDDVIDDLDAGESVAEAAEGFADAVGAGSDPDAEPAPTSAPRDDEEASATGGAAAATDSGDGGSGAGLLIVLALIAAAVIGFVVLSRRKRRSGNEAEVASARAEINAVLAVVAAEIVEHEATMNVSGNERAIALYREANATYNAVSDQVAEVTDLAVLADLNDRIDHARWQLEAAEALVEGRTPPPEPQPDAPGACFFDPTHRPGTERAVLRTEAGEKEVGVCRDCASKLERGESPQPRMVEVGGRRVPSARAPRSHGGLGMGGLSVFEIILGGLGALGAARGNGGASRAGTGIDWSDMLPGRGPTRRPDRSSTPFGIDRLPSWSGGRTSRPSGTRSSGSSSRGSSPKGPAMGRGRRRR